MAVLLRAIPTISNVLTTVLMTVLMNALVTVHMTILMTVLLVSPPARSQESTAGDHVRIRFVLPTVFSSTEETLVGLLFELDPHWHVYWRNPGDSGAAPKFSFTLQNAEVGPIQWPKPKRLPVAHLTNIGYEGAVAYLFSVKPSGAGPVRVTADLEWLVCQEECIPGLGKIRFERPVRAGPSEWKDAELSLIRGFAATVPSPSDSAPFRLSARVQSGALRVRLDSVDKRPLSEIDLFPLSGEFVPAASPRREGADEFVFQLSPSAGPPSRLGFVAASGQGSWEFPSVEIGREEGMVKSDAALWALILSAALGGFLLNLMPCVFPVVSIKAFSLLKADGRQRVHDCLLYALGVIVTFAALGGAFLALRGVGASIGWGFQLQSPLVVFALILLFWSMALNFLGVFELGTSVMNLAGRQTSRSSSFATGALSVFVAAPCTGPFMGTALGAAATLPWLAALLIFIALGIGLALPFLVFAGVPRVLSWLPRPGPWMETLKQFFAFPLFATVLWLLWVLGQQTDTRGWLLSSAAILAVSFAFWLGRGAGRARLAVAWLVGLGAVATIGSRLSATATAAASQTQGSAWLSYDEKKLDQARSEGRAVFVDFTAAWCITCQVNKQTVLDTEAGQASFKRATVLLMRADWTRYDPVITQALAKLGRNSVPVYAFYPSDGSEPRLLPQLLTPSMIENLNARP